jgi:hypothetical protein
LGLSLNMSWKVLATDAIHRIYGNFLYIWWTQLCMKYNFASQGKPFVIFEKFSNKIWINQ